MEGEREEGREGGHSLESFTRYAAMAGKRQELASSSTRIGLHHGSSPWPRPSATARYSPRMAKHKHTYFSSDFCLARTASMFHVESVEPVPNPVPLAQYSR